MPGVPQDFDPMVLSALNHQMLRFDLLHSERERQARSSASPSSEMAADLQDRSLRHAYDSASFHTMAAIDHLFAVRLLLKGGGLPSFAIMTMFRVALETAAAGYWTVEPEDRDVRRERGFATAWADLVERVKAETCAGGPATATSAQKALLDAADGYGLVLPPVIDADVKVTSPRRLRLVSPGSVRLMQLYPQPHGCEFEYRYLSGYSHGKFWAQAVGLQPDLGRELDHDMHAVPVATPDTHIVASAALAVDALARVVGRLGALQEPGPN
jgi:hypothetical protein